VAIYPGGRDIEDVFVSGGTLTSAQLDPSGQVYLVTIWPLEERLAVTLEYGDAEKPVYLPLVLRNA
jgi:hypothetical protein